MFIKVILILLLMISPAFATTATFQQGTASYAGAKNMQIDVSNPNLHINDADGTGNLYIRPSGVQFPSGQFYWDISTIPTNSTVTSATVDFYVQEQGCGTPTMQAIKITDTDGTGSFNMKATATTGDSSNTYGDYLYKNHGTLTKWYSAGSNSNFTDVNGGAVEGSVVVTACPGAYEDKQMTVTTMVQDWVTTPSKNAGMLVTFSGSADVKFHGQFFATVGNRPLLTVNYSAAGHQNLVQGNSKIQGNSLIQ